MQHIAPEKRKYFQIIVKIKTKRLKYTKGSELRIQYKQKDALIKMDRDRKNGINSTLTVLITRYKFNENMNVENVPDFRTK